MKADPSDLSVTLPIRLVSPLNNRRGWLPVWRKSKADRLAVTVGLKGYTLPKLPVVVTITRIGLRKMDDDNLASSAKATRDSIAAAYGVDDGSPLYRWVYQQETAEGHKRKKPYNPYAVRIEITRQTPPSPASQ